MLKFIGIIMVLWSCFLFSYMKADAIKRKYENLKEIKRVLQILKNEISFSSKELLETISELSQNASGDVAELFCEMYIKMKNDETQDFGQAWKYAKDKISSNKIFSGETQKILDAFCERAGTMSKEIELENIDKTIKSLESEIENEAESYKKNRKLIYAFGGFFGIGILILFI